MQETTYKTRTYYITYADPKCPETPRLTISLRGFEASAKQLINMLEDDGCTVLEVRAVV
jgi:hypothetical protein